MTTLGAKVLLQASASSDLDGFGSKFGLRETLRLGLQQEMQVARGEAASDKSAVQGCLQSLTDS